MYDNNPKVSIIMPVYNVGAYIEECLRSVVSQTYKNIELVMVDDGTKDDSVEIANEVLSRSTIEYKIIKQVNAGACAARNVAISNATGDYLLHLDADDRISETLVEKQIETLRKCCFEPKTIAFCGWIGLEDFGLCISNVITHDYTIPSDMLVDMYLNHVCLYPHCYLVSKQLLEKSGLWDTSLVQDEDGDFFSRIIVCADKILFTPDTKVYYRFGNMASQSKEVSFKAVNGFVETAIKKSKLLLKHSSHPKVKDAIYELVALKPRLYHPYFHEVCEKAEKFLKETIHRKIVYPKVPLAGWIFYWSVRLGLRDFHLKP